MVTTGEGICWWNGKEEWYDRADNQQEEETVEAIRSLLPAKLINSLEEDHGATPADSRNPKLTYAEFSRELRNFVNGLGKSIKLNTKSGVWDLEISSIGEWNWNGPDPRVEVMATPFTNGHALVCRVESDDDDGLDILDADWDVEDLDTENFTSEHYLLKNPTGWSSVETNLKNFIMYSYTPKVRKILDSDEMVDFMGGYENYDAYISDHLPVLLSFPKP